MAEIATDGDHRFSPLGEGDDTISCPKCRIPPPFPGQLSPQGRQVPGPAVVLPDSRRPREPGFADEARIHRRDHLRQSADRDPAARRQYLGPPPRAGAVDWLAAEPADRARDRQSPLAEALRPRHRRDARELRQDGRAADPSGAARLDGRRVHEPRLEHQADQQADDDVGGLPDGLRVRGRRQFGERPGESLSVALPAAAARGRDRPRQHARGRRQHQPGRWRRTDLSVHPARHPGRPVSAASGRTRRKVRRPGAAASTSIGAGRCRTRCSTPSTIPT